MDPNLIIDDDYICSVGKRAASNGKRLNTILCKYVDILGEINTEAIKEGEIAEAVADFKSNAEMMKDKLSELSEKIQKVTECFISEINVADEYLF